jgi:RNA polymerase sigma-70 factor (ECF subfamily)
MADGRSAPPLADAALVAALVDGSEDALAALYDRHAGALHATALRLTGDRQVAEDVVQEVFLTLWNRAELFDPARGTLAAWLGTIARHRAVDRLRAAGRRPRLVSLGGGTDGEPAAAALERALHDEPGQGAGNAAGDPDAAFEAAEARAAINVALALLPEAEREVIVLAYRDDLAQSEIAARLEWPLGTVKTRTRRALARLREALAGVYGPQLEPAPLDEPVERPTATSRSESGGGRG